MPDGRSPSPLTDRQLQDVPLFPLPGCVLLPGGLLPLHVFEPRYRAMVAHALAGDGLIAMGNSRVVANRPDATSTSALDTATHIGLHQVPDEPTCYATVGIGRIICSEQTEDGRYLLLLRGVTRARISAELPQRDGYRRVVAQALPDAPASRDLAQASAALRASSLAFATQHPQCGEQLVAFAHDDNPGWAADAIGAAIIASPSERQALIETRCATTRLWRVRNALVALLDATPAETTN